MASRLQTVLLATALLMRGALAQSVSTVVVDYPDTTAPVGMTAFVVGTDAAKSETTFLLPCLQKGPNGTVSKVGCEPLTYRTSPGGFAMEQSSSRLTTETVTAITSLGTVTATYQSTKWETLNCGKPNEARVLVCDATTVGAFEAPISANSTSETVGTTRTRPVVKETYTSAALLTMTIVTSTSTSPSSTGAGVPMFTHNAMLAGAVALIGGALMV